MVCSGVAALSVAQLAQWLEAQPDRREKKFYGLRPVTIVADSEAAVASRFFHGVANVLQETVLGQSGTHIWRANTADSQAQEKEQKAVPSGRRALSAT
jgi:hypothetical protein